MKLRQLLLLFRDAEEPLEAVTKQQLDAVVGGGGHTIQDEGTDLPARARLNFTGAGVTATDDSVNGQTDVEIPGGGGGVTDHGALTGLADDDHPQYHNDTRGDARYVNESDHTKAAHDALNIDAGTLDGIDAGGFAPSSHVGSGGTSHAAATTALAGFLSAADKAKLNALVLGSSNFGHYERATTLVVVPNTWTTVPLTNEVLDPGWHAADSSDITPGVAGTYLIVIFTQWVAHFGGYRYQSCALNGNRQGEVYVNTADPGTATGTDVRPYLLTLSATDTLSVQVRQSSASDRELNTTSYIKVVRLF